MKKFLIQVSFDNGETTTKSAESNDRVTALNMALNLLTQEQRNTLKNVEFVRIRS